MGETTASKEKAKSTTEAEPRQAEASKEAASEVTTRSRAEEPKLNTHRVMLPIVSLNVINNLCYSAAQHCSKKSLQFFL